MKSLEMDPDYGRCPCGGTYERRLVEVRLTEGSRKVILADVPRGACSSCGSSVYRPSTLARVETVGRALADRTGMGEGGTDR